MLIVVHYCYRFLCTVVTDSCALLLPFFVHSPYHFLCTRDFCLHFALVPVAHIAYDVAFQMGGASLQLRAWEHLADDILQALETVRTDKARYSGALSAIIQFLPEDGISDTSIPEYSRPLSKSDRLYVNLFRSIVGHTFVESHTFAMGITGKGYGRKTN